MKNLFLLPLLTLLLISCATVEPETPASQPEPEITFSPSFNIPPADGLYYYDTLELLKAERIELLSGIDFVKFRFSYLLVRDRDRLWIPPELQENLRDSISTKDHDQTLEVCEAIHEYDFTDIYSHVMRNYFLEQKGQNMTFYKAYVNHLLDSIFDSGDGRSPETAFHIAQVKEEYEALKFMGLSPQEQMTYNKGGHSFNILNCKTENGDFVEVYFDITEHFRILNQILGR